MKKLLFALPAVLCLLALAPSEAPYDLLFVGGRVVDGTGAPWFRGDVGVRDGQIVAIGRSRGKRDAAIDATGLVIAPGFIDLLGQSEYNVLVDNRAASKITPGHHDRDHRRRLLDRPHQRRMIAEGKDVYERYGFTPDLTHARGYCKTLREAAAGHQPRHLRRRRRRARLRDRRGGPPRRPRPSSRRWRPRRPGDARGRLRGLHLAPVRARQVQLDRRDHRDGEGRGAIRRRYITHQRSEANAIDASLDEVFRIAREAGIRRRSGTSRPRTSATGARCPHVLERIAAARAEGSTSPPTSTRGPRERTASTRACRSGCARADARRC